MTSPTPNPHPDSPPEADHDRRSDLERAVTDTNRDIENVHDEAPPAGVDGAVGGTGGVTKNQDDTAQ
ncbi:hypothetical protein J2Y54_000620 [Sphingomonas sp. BE123]|uniref:hypothetical protein n=1 Tax=Sphingomonas sp. BE123 TaxID=2817842 RepID=UPI00285E6D5B|nr:hypothetical protein [Sphingomonas sp. BE123]MDR6851127.1 hypothetical protein [Sphingomonas sp. BE123]